MAKVEKSQQLKEKISILPDTPGCYLYYDAAGTVIYVGKAKNLKRRVSSYFNRTHDSVRTNLLVRAIADMKYIVVPTEGDALNLENSLIKEYKPRYNVLLKDDKSYPWIVVTKEHYPRVFLTRTRIKDGSKYFGPYTNTGIAKAVLNLIRELYPVRTCRHAITPDFINKGKGRLCLEYHLKNCLGCCTGQISPEKYADMIDHVKQILRGETQELLDYLKLEMERLSEELRFEEAQMLKEKYQLVERYQSKSVIVSQTLDDIDVFGIDDDNTDVYVNYMHVRRGAIVRSITLQYKRRLEESIEQILSYAIVEAKEKFNLEYDEIIVPVLPDMEMPGVSFIIPQRGDKLKLLQVSTHNARQNKVDSLKMMEKHNPEQRVERTLERMKSDFRLSELPRHIECFDNSNIQGTNPVASCVVFKNAKPSKRDYRHFNIKTVEGPDDFASMKEVLTRRYTRLMEEGEGLPQLIVVDGGKGQLSAAVEALDDMGLRGTIAVVGIAKRLEEIYFPGDSIPLYIDKNSESLRIVQHLRDEAHRFGITHHRNRRSKGQIISELDEIKGIGDKTQTALLQHFKSVKRLKEASIDRIAEITGPARASIIYSALHPDEQPQ
ncbi:MULTISPECIES: excinuclease ABC subunit UvrC [Muribaculum]|mgnify:FL=1|uniref:excinuclease ABC subunit UvrC n=6 Tax=Muribaculaceae TaxID=2005473 RepID=UPI001093D24A|nr:MULTISPECIES: excinuclease ABC subunit UvrC [Muribaculum]MCX4278334.1 excinuclease ABC subunit UvrC [Muribaculum sp.]TGY04084.1 excinuclease ABC subunit UvrC [Muribaculum sp. NM65_B17]THG43256.1 excinuclease ABC subunit UvrC [Muribaculaceae bacterium]